MRIKKKKGNISKIGIPLITLVVIYICTIVNITSSSDSNKKDELDIIARDYILNMETEGYLKPENEVQLINDLQKMGMKNISLAGTTKIKVGYGKPIYLNINGEVEVTKYKVKNLFTINTVKESVPTNNTKRSTAKH